MDAWLASMPWRGETAVVAASGPSLTRDQLDYCRGRARVAVVNTTYQLAPWANLLYACDRKWWAVHGGAPAFAGRKVSLETTDWDDVQRIACSGKRGFDLNPGYVRTGSNSGYQAVHLVAGTLGAARIVLLGFDMQPGKERDHWHADHPAPCSAPQRDTMARWRGFFDELAPGLAQHGVGVVNATPGSALTCFPRVALEDAL